MAYEQGVGRAPGVTSVDTTSIVRTPAFEVLDLLEEQTGFDRFE